jgi:Tfp pilus assembly protein PilV
MRPTHGKDRRGCSLKRKASADERGFTLVETTIALVVMMIIGLGVASLFVFAINYNSGAHDRLSSLAIAQQRMERWRKTPFTDAAYSSAPSTETITSAGRSYNVTTTICSTSFCGGSSTLKLIKIEVTPLGANGQWAATPITVMSLRATPVVGSYF